MLLTRAQKTFALSINTIILVCLTFGMSLVIMWLITYVPGERSHWWGLGYVAIFGITTGVGLMMWAVSMFRNIFERIYCLGTIVAMCGGWLFGANTAINWWYSARAVELSPYIMLVSVLVSMLGCVILHVFRPDILPILE